jgi:hypothetical protein
MRKISSRASLSKSAAVITDLAEAVVDIGTNSKFALTESFQLAFSKLRGSNEEIIEVVKELKKLEPDQLTEAVSAMRARGLVIPDEILKLLPGKISEEMAKKFIEGLLPKIEFKPAEMMKQFKNLSPEKQLEFQGLWTKAGKSGNIDDYISSKMVAVPPSVTPAPSAAALRAVEEAASTPEQQLAAVLRVISETKNTSDLKVLTNDSTFNMLFKILPDGEQTKAEAALAKRFSELSPVSSPAALRAVDEVIPPPAARMISSSDPQDLGKVSKLIGDQGSILDIGDILHLNRGIKNIAITEGIANKMLGMYKADPVKYIDDYSKLSPEARATLMKLGSEADYSAKISLKEIDRLIEKDVKNLMSPGAKEVGLSPGTSPAKKAIRWGRVGAAVAAGLGGMALLNYVFSDDGAQEEVRREISGNRENAIPSATSDSGYESSSLIMKERGYLKSVQSSWTQEFDTAFRAFIDAGTAKGAVPTNLVGGQSWSDVAGSLGFPPNKSGAFSAIRSVAGLVDKKTSTPTTGVATPTPSDAPASTTPVAAEDNPVLAAIIGAMYNQKLVGTPGFDLIREPKRIRALIESAPVGGPNPTGYGNAARIIMKMNPSIGGMLPAKLTGPVDDKFAKNPANKALLQAIQVAINGIYESAIPTLVKPGLERSRELIARYLNSAAGGNWPVKGASNSVDQWVKLASERKMRIRAEIAAEMTPAEMAAARRIKMREI